MKLKNLECKCMSKQVPGLLQPFVRCFRFPQPIYRGFVPPQEMDNPWWTMSHDEFRTVFYHRYNSKMLKLATRLVSMVQGNIYIHSYTLYMRLKLLASSLGVLYKYTNLCVYPTLYPHVYMEASWNGGNSKASILVGLSIISHPFWGFSIYGNPHIPNVSKLCTAEKTLTKRVPVLLKMSNCSIFFGLLPLFKK